MCRYVPVCQMVCVDYNAEQLFVHTDRNGKWGGVMTMMVMSMEMMRVMVESRERGGDGGEGDVWFVTILVVISRLQCSSHACTLTHAASPPTTSLIHITPPPPPFLACALHTPMHPLTHHSSLAQRTSCTHTPSTLPLHPRHPPGQAVEAGQRDRKRVFFQPEKPA